MCLLIGLNGLCDQQQISRTFSVEQESADWQEVKQRPGLNERNRRFINMNTVNDSLLKTKLLFIPLVLPVYVPPHQ